MHQQSVEGAHLDALGVAVVEVGDLFAHDRDPLVGREQRPLAVVAGDADDQPVDDLGRAQDDVGMAVGDRIEGAGIDPDAPLAHGLPSSASCGSSAVVGRSPPSPFSSSTSGKRATETTRSPSPTLKTTTPWLRRAARCGCRRPAADHHAGIGDQHDLVVSPDRKHRDDGIAVAALEIHVVDALPAAPGDAVVIGRAAHAEALFGDAQHEFLALRRDRRIAPRRSQPRPAGSASSSSGSGGSSAVRLASSSPFCRRRSAARLR